MPYLRLADITGIVRRHPTSQLLNDLEPVDRRPCIAGCGDTSLSGLRGGDDHTNPTLVVSCERWLALVYTSDLGRKDCLSSSISLLKRAKFKFYFESIILNNGNVCFD